VPSCSPSNYALDQRLDATERRDSARLRDCESIVNTIAVLESVLVLAPTTLDMGLMPLELLHLESRDSLQQEIADLLTARDASGRYSAIQIMSSDELKFLVDTFAKSESTNNVMFKLRALLYFEDSQTIYLWNDKGYHSVLKLA
jgi:hypothetical protein